MTMRRAEIEYVHAIMPCANRARDRRRRAARPPAEPRRYAPTRNSKNRYGFLGSVIEAVEMILGKMLLGVAPWRSVSDGDYYVEMRKTLLLGVRIDHLLRRAARRCDALRIVDYQLRDDLRNVVSAC